VVARPARGRGVGEWARWQRAGSRVRICLRVHVRMQERAWAVGKERRGVVGVLLTCAGTWLVRID
jgi:hypothetical protein